MSARTITEGSDGALHFRLEYSGKAFKADRAVMGVLAGLKRMHHEVGVD
ncbi:hypothetical protein [Roseobacter litoralis]|nr:hypothetical protein [Roseobacter litoralis]